MQHFSPQLAVNFGEKIRSSANEMATASNGKIVMSGILNSFVNFSGSK